MSTFSESTQSNARFLVIVAEDGRVHDITEIPAVGFTGVRDPVNHAHTLGFPNTFITEDISNIYIDEKIPTR
jgi:hypothetical protein